MKEKEMKEIAKLIVDVLKGGKNIKKEVKHLCDKIYR
jgi:glycine/serine hydroxymethyltransferase